MVILVNKIYQIENTRLKNNISLLIELVELRVKVEIWDAYFEDGTLAGCDLIRGEQIPNGLYHLVCEIVVRHNDAHIYLCNVIIEKLIKFKHFFKFCPKR